MKRHVLSVLVENQSGVLIRVSGLFSRRGYNIDSLSVGETEDPKVSRMTIVVRGDDHILEQIKKQLKKLIDVIKVVDLDPEQSVFRELALIKVKTNMTTRASVIEIVDIFRANIVDVAADTLTVEMTGDEAKIEAFIALMDSYGIAEIVRTGLTALQRGNKAIKNLNEI
ncbi:acetolactate synthase small subunit [[Clostridium] cellulosi]|uniref:Acetolactate synthase small subunit n=1 Tax=[Clostridium] cellulosi TaxID=29343 RepID=A0A078KKM8_9FIRM|nr:acetolactate synthase small subunit [[Clostridium] cellulosi]